MATKRAHTEHALRTILRNAGLRATRSRLEILAYLSRHQKPLSHNDVAQRLEHKDADRVTVYRNLLDLVRVGLARKIDVGDHVWRFELLKSDAHERKGHPHFVCTDCGSIECLPDLQLSTSKRGQLPRSVRKQQVEYLLVLNIRRICKRARFIHRFLVRISFMV